MKFHYDHINSFYTIICDEIWNKSDHSKLRLNLELLESFMNESLVLYGMTTGQRAQLDYVM